MDYSKDNNNKRRKKAKSKQKKAKNKVGVILFRVLLALVLVGGFAVAGAAVGAYIGILETAPKLDMVSVVPENYASVVYSDDGLTVIDKFTGVENREYAPLSEIPVNLRNAFIAIEDERFYSHNGIDAKGTVRAVYSTVFQDERQGGSTITQQVIKNNVLGIQRNTIDSKIKEQYLAVKYEGILIERLGSKQAAKDYILEAYLNTIGLHHGLNGVKTAAEYYFDKELSELTLPECAVIAAITQRPGYYTPAVNPENNKVRQKAVLKKMLDLGFITEIEYNEALAAEEEVYGRIGQYNSYDKGSSDVHSYFADELIDVVARDLVESGRAFASQDAYNMIYNGGLKIYSTVQPEMQALLEATFEDDSFFSASDFRIDVIYNLSLKNNITGEDKHIEERGTVYSKEEVQTFVNSVKDQYITENMTELADRVTETIQPQAAMVVLDYHNGHVKAIIGGRGKKTTNRGFNRATQSKRSPGSVFKVLTSYAPAIDLGLYAPGSIIIDEPIDINGYSPKNWNGQYKGPVSVRDGIVNSMNIVTVKILSEVGIETCFDYLHNFGFNDLVEEPVNGRSDKGLAIALGGLTDGVTQIEVTAAYGAIANDGIYLKPTYYTKVVDQNNNVLLEYDPELEKRTVLKKSSADMLTDMMKDAILRGTGSRAKFTNVNMPVAGKTGTSQDTKDLTFVGYTPYYVAGIWLGYDKDINMKDGQSYHLNIWKHVMENIHANLEYKDFDSPNLTTSVAICTDSGKRAVMGLCDKDYRGNRVRTDLFSTGGGPTASCDVHAEVVIDTLTGRLADASTPESRKRKVITAVLPNADITIEGYDIPDAILPEDEIEQIDIPDDNYNDPLSGLRPPVTVTPTPQPIITEAPVIPEWIPSPEPTNTPQINNDFDNPNNNFNIPQPTPTPQFFEVPEYNTNTPTPPPANDYNDFVNPSGGEDGSNNDPSQFSFGDPPN